MKERVTVIVNGNAAEAAVGTLLSEVVSGEHPCGGHGRCGKCKVIARGALSEPSDAERRLLTREELLSGVRLACLTEVRGDCTVESLSDGGAEQIAVDGVMPKLCGTPRFRRYGAAIDVGTTTLAAHLYGEDLVLAAETACLNPQAEWGADVVSRIEAALGGRAAALAASIRTALCGVLTALASRAGIDPCEIDAVVVTGNTVMLSLLTEESVEPFSHAPFRVTRLFGETLTAEALGLSVLAPHTEIYLPPSISAFIGADTTCALLATSLCREDTAMLADVGTNGEMALVSGGRLTVCSTAAGPAFEGAGISMGMRGESGAIDRVTIVNGALHAHVIGETEPRGICGSGLVDAVAAMRALEMVDEGGSLDDDPTAVAGAVTLTQRDIRMLQLAKSAICAGLLTLLDSAGISARDVKTTYIAGGFGKYLNVASAAEIGLFPADLTPGARAVGNAALAGASMLLLDADLRSEAERLAAFAEVVDLAANPTFSDHYVDAMWLTRV